MLQHPHSVARPAQQRKLTAFFDEAFATMQLPGTATAGNAGPQENPKTPQLEARHAT